MIYKVKLPEAYARIEWCKSTFGESKELEYIHYNNTIDLTNNLRWWRRQGHVFFRKEKDYIFYCLTWL